MSKISGLSQLDCFDIDENLPNLINSRCYFPSDFERLELICQELPHFSIFHVNLSSLDSHFEILQAALSLINFPFQTIAICESRENSVTDFKMNNNLEGFTLYSQPTLRAAGVVAFYANSFLDISVRSDLII